MNKVWLNTDVLQLEQLSKVTQYGIIQGHGIPAMTGHFSLWETGLSLLHHFGLPMGDSGHGYRAKPFIWNMALQKNVIPWSYMYTQMINILMEERYSSMVN